MQKYISLSGAIKNVAKLGGRAICLRLFPRRFPLRGLQTKETETADREGSKMNPPRIALPYFNHLRFQSFYAISPFSFLVN